MAFIWSTPPRPPTPINRVSPLGCTHCTVSGATTSPIRLDCKGVPCPDPVLLRGEVEEDKSSPSSEEEQRGAVTLKADSSEVSKPAPAMNAFLGSLKHVGGAE